MPLTTWIRDLFGIRKDIVDTEKAELEIDKLEAEARARNLITPATMGDVKKYDSKLKRLLEKMRDDFGDTGSTLGRSFNPFKRVPLWVFGVYLVLSTFALLSLIGLVLYGIAYVLYYAFSRLSG